MKFHMKLDFFSKKFLDNNNKNFDGNFNWIIIFHIMKFHVELHRKFLISCEIFYKIAHINMHFTPHFTLNISLCNFIPKFIFYMKFHMKYIGNFIRTRLRVHRTFVSVPLGPVQACTFENSLQWCHNGHDGVSNHQLLLCLLVRLFWRRSTKTSKLCSTGFCVFVIKRFFVKWVDWELQWQC